MLAGGPTVNRALLASLYPPGSRVKNNGTVWLDNPDRVIPYTDQFTAGYERQLWSTTVGERRLRARARPRSVHAAGSESGASHVHVADRDARTHQSGVSRAR